MFELQKVLAFLQRREMPAGVPYCPPAPRMASAQPRDAGGLPGQAWAAILTGTPPAWTAAELFKGRVERGMKKVKIYINLKKLLMNMIKEKKKN